MNKKLNRIEIDLARYAQDKIHALCHDTIQFGDIADIPRGEIGACLGALFLRMAVAIAIESKWKRKRWMNQCDRIFTTATKAK